MIDAANNMNNWYAVHVKSRHEFVSAKELIQKGIDTFLPSVLRLRQWKDRRKEIEFPVFPGYLFVNVSLATDTYFSVLKTRGVVSYISLNPGHPTPVNQEEINSLRLIINSGQEMDIYPHLKEGKRVRIMRGPLQTAEGLLEKKEGQHYFVVNVDILGRSVSVKIYADDIEPA